MWNLEKQSNNLKELIENAPKELNREFLRHLNVALFHQRLEQTKDTDAVINSLLMMVLDDATLALDRYLAIMILQKMSPSSGLSEILMSRTTHQLLNALPILLIQGTVDSETKNVIRKVAWSLHEDNLNAESQRLILSFLSKIVTSPHCPLTHEEIKKILSLIPSWIRGLVIPSTGKPSRFKKSPSTLSITEVDGTNSQDFFTILNYAQVTNPEQFLNIQVFSMLRSWLLNASKNDNKTGKEPCPRLADLVSEELSFNIHEYCQRIMEQVDRKTQTPGIAEFQKACLVEAIALLDVICRADSGMVHSILPRVRRIYDQIASSIIKHPQVQDVAVLTAAMQFFINHSSAVMFKADSLYPFLFCDLLNVCYRDNMAAFEIISLIKENLAQLCYHSSILEKYFPTFFKVLAWRPVTFLDDFLQILPAFMSQQTSVEVFHALLDLPCMTAVLVLTNTYNTTTREEGQVANTSVLEILKKPELIPMFKFVLRKTSGIGDTFDRVKVLHQTIAPLSSHPRVSSCAKAVTPLLRCFFSTFLQYADESLTVLLIPSLLERSCLIFPVPKFCDEILCIFADAILQLFDRHPESVFHCQKELMDYFCHLKNYSVAEQCFINLVWSVGEYASLEYSDLCRPEVITLYYEGLESTVYEILSSLSQSSDDLYLKLISVSLSTLAKLSARSQDLIPRAVLCLSKAYKQLSSFQNDHNKAWKIVTERIFELIAVLKTPNVASVVLSPSKELESGRLHRDGTSLPFVLRAVSAILGKEKQICAKEKETL